MSLQMVARRYASALADVVLEKGEAREVQAELAAWEQMFQSSPALQEVLRNPTIALDQKRERGLVWIPNRGSNSVSIIDAASATLVTTGVLLSLSITFAIMATSIPLNTLQAIFAGENVGSTSNVDLFVGPMRIIWLVMAAVSLASVIPSALRGPKFAGVSESTLTTARHRLKALPSSPGRGRSLIEILNN